MKSACTYLITLTLVLGSYATEAQVCNKANIAESVSQSIFDTETEGSNVVVDIRNKLLWLRCPIGFNSLGSICTNKKYVEGSTSELQRKKFTWQEALNIADQYEQNTSSGLKSDWRLPNIRELMSIIDTSCISPAFNSAVFPLIPSSTKSGLWSSSPQLVNPTSDRQKAWLIQTAYGDIIHDYITEKHFVLLVHSLP